MFLFRDAPVGDKAQLQKRMSSVPNEIIEGLLAKFAEHSRNSTEYASQSHLDPLFEIEGCFAEHKLRSKDRHYC
jgi:hypothetical protein